jgi:hypothetical protein
MVQSLRWVKNNTVQYSIAHAELLLHQLVTDALISSLNLPCPIHETSHA